jgi:magnesium transporter
MLSANSSQLATRQAELALEQTRLALRQNEDMRRISAWVAIVAVPTLIAGIYGMNFDHMPELRSSLGYPAALGAMATISLVLYLLFRRSGWL